MAGSNKGGRKGGSKVKVRNLEIGGAQEVGDAASGTVRGGLAEGNQNANANRLRLKADNWRVLPAPGDSVVSKG